MRLNLDGQKLIWHRERLLSWLRGDRIAPVTIDCSLTRRCNFRCIPPTEMVLLENGTEKSIAEVEIGDQVASINEYGQLTSGTVTHSQQTSERERIFEIKTEIGLVLRCTPDHRISTPNGWTEARYLLRGDLIGKVSDVVKKGNRTSEAKCLKTVNDQLVKVDWQNDCLSTSKSKQNGADGEGTIFRGNAQRPISENVYFTKKWKDTAWSDERMGERITSKKTSIWYRSDIQQRSKKEGNSDFPRVRGCGNNGKTNENKQSDEKSHSRIENGENLINETRNGIFRENEENAPFWSNTPCAPKQKSEEVSKRTNDKKQSNEESRDSKEEHGNKSKKWNIQSTGTMDKEEYRTEQNGRADSKLIKAAWVHICRGRKVLDRPMSKREMPESRFHLEKWENESGDSLPFEILAFSVGQCERNAGLQTIWLENICNKRKELAARKSNYSSGKQVVEWTKITSIEPIGHSPTYDIQVEPHHNFIASGIIVHNCSYCYGQLQENEGRSLNEFGIFRFLDDAAEIGVKGVSFVSDGESTLSPHFLAAVKRGKANGLDMAVGTNGLALKKRDLPELLPRLTYLRFNISAADPKRYSQIHGVPESFWGRVIENVGACVAIKHKMKLNVTIGLQMVLLPSFADQIMPLARLGRQLGVDYTIIKHCSDDEDHALGVDYSKYRDLDFLLKRAEALSTDTYQVAVKWSKIMSGGKRRYSKCYGPAFIMQFSGSGLVAPCGMLFNDKYKKYHIGNIGDTGFKDIWRSERYREVLEELRSDRFDARTMCGSLCLQHKVNEYLWDLLAGENEPEFPTGTPPQHRSFI